MRERFAAPVTLGLVFNDNFVEAIYPHGKVVELFDGTKVHIVRKLATFHADALPLPSEQEYDNYLGRASPKLKMSRPVTTQPGPQVWVHVTNGRTGLSDLVPDLQMYAKHHVSLSNGVAHITALREFKVLVTNFATLPSDSRTARY